MPKSALLSIAPAVPQLPPDRGRLLTVQEVHEELCRGIPSLKWVRGKLANCPYVPMGNKRLYYETDARKHVLVRVEAA